MAFDYATAFSRNIGWLTEEEQERLRHKRVAMPIDGTLLHAVRGRGRSRGTARESIERRIRRMITFYRPLPCERGVAIGFLADCIMR